jgi:aspartyl-tRNA(Asn)/glutamyl-tRNA(Gln) amidotransferase subunit B
MANVGLAENQVEIIISNPKWLSFFNEVLLIVPPSVDPKLVANYFINDLIALIGVSEKTINDVSVTAFSELMTMLSEGVLTSRVAKDLMAEIVFSSESPRKLATERGLLQDNSTDSLQKVVEGVIAVNETVVLEYKAGKTASIQFLLGQCMKATKGSGNPEVLRTILEEKLR